MQNIVAMVHTGMGPVQINNLLAALNLPPVVPSTLKRREQKIDTTLETVAKKSCLEAQKEEIEKGNGKVINLKFQMIIFILIIMNKYTIYMYIVGKYKIYFL